MANLPSELNPTWMELEFDLEQSKLNWKLKQGFG